MDKIRWGVIGAGGIADTRTIPGMLRCENAELTAVMRTDMARAKATQEKWQCAAAYDNVDALLADPNVDAVYIATPVHVHAAQCMAAADAGKHILCEKPLAMDVAEGEQMLRYCKEKGVQLGAGLMMRFGTHARTMKRLVAEGAIGKSICAVTRFAFWYPEIPGAWRQVKAQGGGGAMMDVGVHSIDLTQYILGTKVKEVTAMHDTLSFSYEVDDSSAMLLRMENGCQCVVQSHFNLPLNSATNCLEIFGEQGHLRAHGILGQVDGGTLDAGLAPGYTLPEADFDNLYTRQIESFSRSLLEGTPLKVPAEDALQVQRVMEAAYRSNDEGRTIRL